MRTSTLSTRPPWTSWLSNVVHSRSVAECHFDFQADHSPADQRRGDASAACRPVLSTQGFRGPSRLPVACGAATSFLSVALLRLSRVDVHRSYFTEHPFQGHREVVWRRNARPASSGSGSKARGGRLLRPPAVGVDPRLASRARGARPTPTGGFSSIRLSGLPTRNLKAPCSLRRRVSVEHLGHPTRTSCPIATKVRRARRL